MSSPAAVAAPLSSVASPRRDGRYNFIVLTLDGLGFWLGMSYFSPTTILPLFVSYLTPSNVLVGAVPAVVFVCWAAPQLAGARALALQPSRKRFIIRTALLGRIPLLLAIGATAALAVSHPGVTLFLFLTGFGLFRLSGGLNTPAYYDLVASAISPRVRARFLGTSQFLGGAVGAAGLIAGRRVLDSYPFPVGFVICFAIGFVFMTAAIGCMALVREPPFVPRALDGPAGGRDTERPGLFRDARATLRRDSGLRRYLGGRILLVIGGMAAAFFAVQATRTFGASAGDVAALTAVLLASQTLSTLFWGAGADRIGLTPVLFASAVLCTAAPAAALLAPDLLWFTLVFVLVGLSAGALAVTDAGMPLALAEGTGARAGGGPAHYIALSNTVLAPFHVAAPLLGGLLADVGGYRLTAAVALLASAAAVLAIALAAPTVRRRGGAAGRAAL